MKEAAIIGAVITVLLAVASFEMRLESLGWFSIGLTVLALMVAA